FASIVYNSLGAGKTVWLGPAYFWTPSPNSGSADRLLEQAVAWAAATQADPDWYSIDVTNTDNVLRLETSTPGDGPNLLLNKLDPHIERSAPRGTLVAGGTAMDAGRNEFILYQPLVTGTYRVRVTAEGGTSGEYFLTKNFSPVVSALAGPDLAVRGQPLSYS